MRDLSSPNFTKYRNVMAEHQHGHINDIARNGIFNFPSPLGAAMHILATSGEGWEHVSISLDEQRTPQWIEMEFVKRIFFKEDECVVQIHAPLADYVDGHFLGGRAIYTLHLWRPLKKELPRPPWHLVGPRNEADAARFGLKVVDRDDIPKQG